MDNKRLILAVAGSGKTYYIVQQLNENNRFLLITYTISGTENLINEIVKRFGYLPNNIKVLNYFSYLYTFCYKPYLSDEINEKGISWKYPKSVYDHSAINKSRYLYHNRLSKLITENIIEDVKKRTEKYFDFLLIDEIQDFAGNDYNFLLHLFAGNFNLLLVGDFYQHTFDTSRDKQTNKSLHRDIETYTERFVKSGIKIDTTTLLNSRRCSKSTCEFINSRIGIDIKSEFDFETECKLITDETEIKQVFENDTIVKLFYQKHYDFKCNSDNWGNCKGLTYDNVCVIINDEIFKQMYSNELINFKAQTTKNKFYVACSRTKNNLYFIHDKEIKKLK